MTDLFLTIDESAGLVDSVASVADHTVTITDSAGLVDVADPRWYTDVATDNPVDEPPAPAVPPELGDTADTTDTPPAVDPVPTGVPEPRIIARCKVWPTPVLTAGRPDPDVWLPTSETVIDCGRFQVVIGGVDRTFWRNVPVIVGEYVKNQPFGDNTLELTLPQVTIFDRLGVGDLSWLKPGVSVELHRRTSTGRKVRFEGLVPKFGAFERGRDGGMTVHVLGALYEADLAVHKPAFYYLDVDAGTRIRQAFQECPSRHYVAPTAVTTGVPTRKRGDMSQSPLGFVGELLAMMTTADGLNQWTVDKIVGRRAVLRLKDITTVDWTFAAGAPGVEVDLEQDWTGGPNVIYGEGVAPDGCTWRNAKWPNARPDDAPPYPYSDPSRVITIGTVGDEVILWQREMVDHGYPVVVDGYYGTEDAYQCRRLQEHAGILVDGIVGPQTWAATFQVGSNTGDLTGAWIMPLAWRKEVMPKLYNARGEIIGDNPDYDPSIVRVEVYVNFGDGVTKRDATRQARADLHRFANPGWLGTITVTTDPEEGTKFDIDAGDGARLRYFEGTGATGLRLHVSGVVGSPEDGKVTMTVDSKARDLMRITAIRQRDRDAHSPAFDHLGNRTASQVRDVATWDCENGSGVVPLHALYGGLYTVLKIPAGRLGTIAQTRFTTSGPHSKFAIAIFSKPIQAADLVSIVGNPLTTSKAWTSQYDALLEFGWLIGWGDKDQPAGYFPGLGSDSDPLTGRLVDDASWNYQSDYGSWLWVAEFASESCFISGRLRQAVPGL